MSHVRSLPFATPRRTKLSLLSWLSLWRTRRQLAELTDAQLRDIGLTRSEAEVETKRAYWDAPCNWFR